jgi:hypothetical protein
VTDNPAVEQTWRGPPQRPQTLAVQPNRRHRHAGRRPAAPRPWACGLPATRGFIRSKIDCASVRILSNWASVESSAPRPGLVIMSAAACTS